MTGKDRIASRSTRAAFFENLGLKALSLGIGDRALRLHPPGADNDLRTRAPDQRRRRDAAAVGEPSSPSSRTR
jgi:hypothetical protein